MGRRQKEWAARVRDWLFDQLGRVCKLCGSTRKLEFDCIEAMGHEHHRMSFDQRMSFYRRQFFVNNLQVLCQHCNAKKGNRPSMPVEDFLPDEPETVSATNC